jgi:hypothetical protein
MPCDVRNFGNVTVVVCSRRRKSPPCSCGRPSVKLCDFPLTGPKTGTTCDKPICDRCATSVGENLDYCRVHAGKR